MNLVRLGLSDSRSVHALFHFLVGLDELSVSGVEPSESGDVHDLPVKLLGRVSSGGCGKE